MPDIQESATGALSITDFHETLSAFMRFQIVLDWNLNMAQKPRCLHLSDVRKIQPTSQSLALAKYA